MKKKLKYSVGIILLIGAIIGGTHFYQHQLNYNFRTVTEGKVFSSGVIKPEKIKDYVAEHHIKTIVDFRHPKLKDPLNPDNQDEIDIEKAAVAKIESLQHFSIPSGQVPQPESLEKLFKILDNPDNYPVLMHCYHGTGRAKVYSAVYRIEYENFTNEQARLATRSLVKFSSFDDGTPKGEFLKSYKKRNAKN